MGIRRAIATFIRDPEPVTRREDVEPGLNIADGIAVAAEPLRSPIRQHPCIGFHYRAYVVSQGRALQPSVQPLKDLDGYGSFTLKMEGGDLEVVWPKEVAFSHAEHRELAAHYGSALVATEDLIVPGSRVRVRGRLKRRGGRSVFELRMVAVLEPPASQAKKRRRTR